MVLITYQYHTRNLLIDKFHNENVYGIKEEVYELQGDFTDIEDDLVYKFTRSVLTCFI